MAVWELVFMLVILKIPIVYLSIVIWWAISAEPVPPDLAEVAVPADTSSPPGSPRPGRPRRPRPARPHSPGLTHGASALRQRGGLRA